MWYSLYNAELINSSRKIHNIDSFIFKVLFGLKLNLQYEQMKGRLLWRFVVLFQAHRSIRLLPHDWPLYSCIISTPCGLLGANVANNHVLTMMPALYIGQVPILPLGGRVAHVYQFQGGTLTCDTYLVS